MLITKSSDLKRLFSQIYIALILTAVFPMTENSIGFANSPHLDYMIDAELVYTDLLKRPHTDSNFDVSSGLGLEIARYPRILGLKKIALDLTWSYKSSHLHLELRPDALLHRDPSNPEIHVREYDGRSGTAYQLKEVIYLLNSYHIGFNRDRQLIISAGVYNDFATPFTSYISNLEFGLIPLFPQIFSGIQLGWRRNNLSNRRQIFDIYLITDRHTRGEVIRPNTRSFDRAPTSLDPYTGLGFQASFFYDEHIQYRLACATGDSKRPTGVLNELYSTFGATGKTKPFDYPTQSHLEFRFLKERWQLKQNRAVPLVQTSFSWTNRSALSSNSLLLTYGIHYGKSERHITNDQANKAIYMGWQIDSGLEILLESNLRLVLSTSTEFREVAQLGKKTGAFIGEGQNRHLSRFSIGIHYHAFSNDTF